MMCATHRWAGLKAQADQEDQMKQDPQTWLGMQGDRPGQPSSPQIASEGTRLHSRFGVQ